ncbi:BREX-1 system adenine-specific DNA-methyltransferase PglX [Sphingobacterium siyangense]|uniref:BREX-1 system adenine-specific DNA-methyltransferase PglX n=1 Tax=Sphingobacterium TaxID=28453 RepID=UPI002FDCEA22
MDTVQLKRFAQEARKKLSTLVDGKLEAVLKDDSGSLRAKQDTIRQLQTELEKLGREALVDKVAYTWFNRLVAIRFMDANGFQPLGVNILSPAEGIGGNIPQILNDIHAGQFPDDLKIDHQYINDVLNGVISSNNPDNTIYRHVLIAVCNDLHRIFPFLFERIDDYSELLLPDDLTSPFSILADMVAGMSVSDCAEVEIIGWLYQFYISEKKDEVFAAGGKVRKEDIPARTQLFTPRWIVEYMVQNTVGKLWLQNNPQSKLKEHMPYYIESAEGSSADYLQVDSVEDIKLLDQACGSGHILVYGFELLAKIYEEEGYGASEIPTKIIENNLYGLEIDDRAAQLAAFAITMKARQYYRRFFRKAAVPQIICYQDIKFSEEDVIGILSDYSIENKEAFKYDLQTLEQATNLGSLIQPHTSLPTLKAIEKQLADEGESSDAFKQQIQIKLKNSLQQLVPLAEKYHCVVDNPPYMGGGNMNLVLGDFVKTNYPKSKADLMACFMEAGIAALQSKGLLGMINQHTWMFLSSYEELRKDLIDTVHFDTLLHLGPRTFPEIGGEVVQNAAFTFLNCQSYCKGTYLRLVDFDNSHLKKEKTLEVIQNLDSILLFNANQNDFKKIPGNPIGYWVGIETYLSFENLNALSKDFNVKSGVMTGNDDRFLRYWSEISFTSIGFGYSDIKCVNYQKYRFFPLNKEEGFRKWTGRFKQVLHLEKEGNNFSDVTNLNYRLRDSGLYFKKGISWGDVAGGNSSYRFQNEGLIFAARAPMIFTENINLLAFLNSKVSNYFQNVLNPTLSFNLSDLDRLPISPLILQNFKIEELTKECLQISNIEWNSNECSWSFMKNELLRDKGQNLKNACNLYKRYWKDNFLQLHSIEEKLNKQFIEIYGLEDELIPNVPFEEVTILKEETKIIDNQLVFQEKELIAQLLSYAIGCVFGRYSLDKEGLILANQGETIPDYLSKVEKTIDQLQFVPDADNVIPVLEEEWFDDDIVNRVKVFIRAVWGEQSYTENMQYIEEVLGKDLRKYLTKDFYKDHIKRYKKRPIYWQFSSPKGHFNVLIYMHRYTQDTLNHILNSYLRPFMEKVRNDIARQQDIIVTGSASEQGKAHKRQGKLRDILRDCEAYEHDILYPLAGERTSIDLDDGVLVNYNKFGHAIAPVAGLNDVKTKNKVKGFDWIDTSTIR